MSWNVSRSRDRIEKLKQSVPQSTIDVRKFDQVFLEGRERDIAARGKRLGRDGSPIVNIPTNQAVLVNGVHVYVQLLDFHDRMLEQGKETEASHKKLLQFLHLHYSATDRVVEQFQAQRVDYHGPRLHAVVVAPTTSERERALKAIAFATTVKKTIEEAGQRLGGQRLSTRVRIGIDSGMAVAVNSGRPSEPEPLFLGSPANHAAKLSEGNRPGIFLSDRVRAILNEITVGANSEAYVELAEDVQYRLSNISDGRPSWGQGDALTRARVEEAVNSLLEDVTLSSATASEAVFRFHYHEPPLRTIRFDELMPSNSIRMPVVSAFADLSGFTAYVDSCIAANRVQEMTANLHVIRGELALCARDDFGARKVSFIGDCIHGLIAKGDATETDRAATVEAAVLLAGGLRSSFELCRILLPNVASLGLAVGLELGPTPVTRLGIRGERSVRCSSSKAVSAAEALQSELEGTQTALGPEALAEAPFRVRQVFRDGPAENLDYEAAEALLLPTAPAAVASTTSRPEFRAHDSQ